MQNDSKTAYNIEIEQYLIATFALVVHSSKPERHSLILHAEPAYTSDHKFLFRPDHLERLQQLRELILIPPEPICG